MKRVALKIAELHPKDALGDGNQLARFRRESG
jgi:hypothetical protein